MKSKFLAEFKDPENIASALIFDSKKFDELGTKLEVKPITGSDGIAIFSSVAVTEFEELGSKTKNYQSEEVASNALFSADSMTKMITAATVLRMGEEEKYQEFLPKGIETKLSDLLPILKKHYPNSTYIQTQLELQQNFTDITLQHLAQHTSGLASVEGDIFRDSNQKLTPDEMIDAAKKPKTGEFGERIGEYFYNDLGYELLGRIVVAVDSEQKRRTSKFGDVVDELVISRVRKKIGEDDAANLRFFTSDQMKIVDGRTVVASHPELSVKFGKDYHGGKFKETPSHFYDMSCGGSYASAESMNKIAFHILQANSKFSVFKKPETLEIFNSRQISKRKSDGSLEEGKTYGFGYESYSNLNYQQYRTHGGFGYGSNSNVFVDTKENRVAVCFVGFENLTLPLAYALTNEERAETPIKLTPELYKKASELYKNYSELQLVEMRSELDKSYEKFREKLELFEKLKIDQENLKPAYTKGLNPTTKEFSDYINNSKDWANISKEIGYFIKLSESQNKFERVDAKGYVLTCMFKILTAVSEFENGKREIDPRKNIDEKTRVFLGGDLSVGALRQKTVDYGKQIIEQHGNDKTAYGLSAVASVYGTRAYMQYKGLLSEEEARPEQEPEKYQDIGVLGVSTNAAKNIALAMEKFEQSAELGNVRSMGSVITWAEKCNDKMLLKTLNDKWTKTAAMSSTPNPNAQIDYGKMLQAEGDLQGAKRMFQEAARFGLEKAEKQLVKLSNVDALDLAKRPSSSPEKSYTEKMVASFKGRA